MKVKNRKVIFHLFCLGCLLMYFYLIFFVRETKWTLETKGKGGRMFLFVYFI
jgi:hypothetical protein